MDKDKQTEMEPKVKVYCTKCSYWFTGYVSGHPGTCPNDGTKLTLREPAPEPNAFYKQYSEQDVPHGAMPPCRHFFRNSMSSEPGDYVCKSCGAIGVEISPDQQRALAIREPATEPDKFVTWVREDISEVDWLRQKLNEEVKYGIAADKKIEKLKSALALRDVPQWPDDREIVAEWRSCLCAAWASGHRAVMTMLLKSGPSYPARSVPVGPEGKK